MNLAEVTWIDAHSIDPWGDIPSKWEPLTVVSVGYIKEFPDGVVMIPNLALEQPSSDETCFGAVHIPRGCITLIRHL